MISLHEMIAGFLCEHGVDRQTAGIVAGRLIRKGNAGAALSAEEAALCEEFLAKASLGPQPEPPDLPPLRRLVERSSRDTVSFRPGPDARPKRAGGALPAGKPIPANKATPAGKAGPGTPGGTLPGRVRQLAHSIAKQRG